METMNSMEDALDEVEFRRHMSDAADYMLTENLGKDDPRHGDPRDPKHCLLPVFSFHIDKIRCKYIS